MNAELRTVANSIIDLLDAIVERDANYVHRVGYRNFDLLELLLADYGANLDTLKNENACNHQGISRVCLLIEQEMREQDMDIQSLRNDHSSRGMFERRSTASGKSLFALRETMGSGLGDDGAATR